MSTGALVPFRHMLGFYVGVCGGPEVGDGISDHFGPHNAAFTFRHHTEDREHFQTGETQLFTVPGQTIQAQNEC